MRALLSTHDKTGVVDLARGLATAGWSLVSSGGTAGALTEAGLTVTDTAELTGFPAILGHRVVTLHPAVHGGILADRDDPAHTAELDAYDITPIDLVVVNLYPFGDDPGTELIDIGGPAMVRAAAKNHAHVGVVVDPGDYDVVLAEITATGALSEATRRRLARTAFATTAAYDTEIMAWLDREETGDVAAGTEGPGGGAEPEVAPSRFPSRLSLDYDRTELALRYGENPHQAAALYRRAGARPWWDAMTQHAGLALSYLNLVDADAAWGLAHDLGDRPAAAIIKHANPCGVAVAGTLVDAYRQAFAGDPRSAFGGIVALNRTVDDDTVAAMVDAAQADVVIAPGYAMGAIDALVNKRKNTRLLEAAPPVADETHFRAITGGLLAQDAHHLASRPPDWRVVSERSPTEAEWADAGLAFRICGWVRSNSIVLVRDGVAWGIGAGQQNRVEAGQLATTKADGRAEGGACASDAFYPFPDGIDAAAEAGVAVVIQPGGAQRDEEVIARADELGVAMIFTGERHFLH